MSDANVPSADEDSGTLIVQSKSRRKSANSPPAKKARRSSSCCSSVAVDGGSTVEEVTMTSAQSQQPINTSIYEIHSDVLKLIIEYVGVGNYRFIAGTCHMFRDGYRSVFGADVCITDTNSIASSVSHAQLFIKEILQSDDTTSATKLITFTLVKILTLGRLDVLKFFKERTRFANVFQEEYFPIETAVNYGHLDVVQWLIELGCPLSLEASHWAARHGHLRILQLLRSHDCPWDEETCSSAAAYGGLEILKWIRQNGCLWDEKSCTGAARTGRLETLKWLRRNGCPWDEDTCSAASANGHFDILKWARKNGCVWCCMTTYAAAKIGHLDILSWAIESGCLWNNAIYDGDDPNIIEYLDEQGLRGR